MPEENNNPADPTEGGGENKPTDETKPTDGGGEKKSTDGGEDSLCQRSKI